MKALHRALIAADLAGGIGRINLADRHPVDTQLPRRLIDHRLDRRHELVLTRPTLRAARRRVR